MKTLLVVIVVLLVGIAGLGFYQGWFHLSTDGSGGTSSATLTVDKDRIQADEQKAKDEFQRLTHKMKAETGPTTEKVNP